MWQAVKRGNKELENIALIGTDECLELFSGILDETDDKTGHLLGKEHVLKNIQKKLEKLNFPNKQMKWIINDIFGHPFDSEKKGLMQCSSPMDFDKKCEEVKPNWIKIESQYTTRGGTEFTSYFEKYKYDAIKPKMSSFCHKKPSFFTRLWTKSS